MSAAVRVDTKALADHRFYMAGKALGIGRDAVLGKMVRVWAVCTDRCTYVLSPEDIDAVAECDGMSGAIVRAGLGEIVDGGIRIKGTDGRIEWLSHLRANAAK